MFDVIKKAMLTGVGLALKTKDEVESLAKEFSKKGKLSEKEGKNFVDELISKYDDAKEKLDEKVESIVKSILSKTDLVRTDELAELKQEITEIKKSLKKKDTSD